MSIVPKPPEREELVSMYKTFQRLRAVAIEQKHSESAAMYGETLVRLQKEIGEQASG